jgi:tripartite-type tricarboxylate transporter receptor subunit TctC
MPVAARALCRRLVWAAVICMALSPPVTAAADEASNYPQRPVRVLVGFTPGGLPDITARLIGPKLLEAWKQQVVVDNRPGAGGIIATDLAAKAAPDGYTLLSITPSHAATPAIRSNLPYDTIKDFAAVTLTSRGAYVLVTSPATGFKTVKDLIAGIKAKRGQLNFASAGVGSGTHFAAELFKDLANVDVVHIAYKGIPEALTESVTGRVQFFFPPLASATSLIRDGRLLALAVTSTKRVSGYGDIPTLAEAGVPDYEWEAWSGLVAPAKTPRPIVARLNGEIARILALPEIQQRMITLGAEAASSTPGVFEKMIVDMVATTARLAKKAGIKAE